MSKTKKLFGVFMLMCMIAIGMIIYMFCTLGNSNGMIKDFELVQEKSGDWDESVVENLEVKVIYQLPDYEKAEFTYKNGEVTDIETEEAEPGFIYEYIDERKKEKYSMNAYGEIVHIGYLDSENSQRVSVAISTEEDSYTLHVYVMPGKEMSTIQESYTFKIDEDTKKANKLLEDKAENQNIKAKDYVKVNGVTNETTLITVSQICGYQDFINISYEKDENGIINDIKFSKIDSNKDSKVYMSTLLDVCKDEEGTIYVCYLEGLKDKEPEYTDYWARRMIVDGGNWCFEQNSDEGKYFWNEEYITRFRFNGIAVRAYKNNEEKSELVYYGYFESEISMLFVENIERVRNGNEIYSSIEKYLGTVDLVEIKLSVEE